VAVTATPVRISPGIRHRAALAALMTLYLAVSLTNLAIVPPIHEDEAWQASVGWKLATEGVFGSDMFAGLGRADERYYGFLPVHPMLLAGMFRVAGLGLLQTRVETVLLGAAVLLLTYAIGRKLWSPAVGIIAVAFLLLVRLDPVTRMTPTGILFLDAPRIGRYDAAVPVFGLAALLAFMIAGEKGRRSRAASVWYAVSGLLAATAALTHVYGAFWLAVIILLAIMNRVGFRNLLAISFAFLIPCLAYAGYVLQDVPAWRVQTEIYKPRFGLLTPSWYGSNIVREPFRYTPGRGEDLRWLLRPGLWFGYGAIATGLFILVRRMRSDLSARAVVVAGVALPLFFAVLVTAKTRNYKMSFLPVWAIAAAWAAYELWRRSRGRREMRAVLLVIGIVVAIEGLTNARSIMTSAATTTPYSSYIERVHAHIRPGERVLGLHAYWLGLEDTDFHSWYVPTTLFEPPGNGRPSPPLVIGTDPDVVLVDSRMRAFLNQSTTGDVRAQAVAAWMKPWSLVATVDDATYGRMEVYRKR
jgi:4-amino-4-deoxy-L-arabinose transferase-like glycosyltransferase